MLLAFKTPLAESPKLSICVPQSPGGRSAGSLLLPQELRIVRSRESRTTRSRSQDSDAKVELV
jgi:hypothetical protein